MKVRDYMSKQTETVRPDDSVQKAAQQMKRSEVGALPVVEGSEVVGVVTDRDIAIRSTADGQNPTLGKVSDCMSTSPVCCGDDEDIQKAVHLMEEHRIRRIPVRQGGNGELVGMLALADIARREPEELTGRLVKSVSQP